MKNKKIISLIILFVILSNIFMGANLKSNAYEENKYINIISKGSYTCMQLDDDFSKIEYFIYLGDDGEYYPSYLLAYDGYPIYTNRIAITQKEDVQDEYMKRIIKAGYPYYSYEELGCTQEYSAYMATQLVLLEYTQGEDLSRYIPCNEMGEEIKKAIEKIKYNINIQTNTDLMPNLVFITDSEWKNSKENIGFKEKSVHIEFNEINFEKDILINSDGTNNTKIVDENNLERNTFLPNEKIKILIPEDSDSMKIRLFASFEYETNSMGYASEKDIGNMFLLVRNPIEMITNVYEDEYKKVKDEIKEEAENNKEENKQELEEQNKEEIKDQENKKESNQENHNTNDNNNDNDVNIKIEDQDNTKEENINRNNIKTEVNITNKSENSQKIELNINPNITVKIDKDLINENIETKDKLEETEKEFENDLEKEKLELKEEKNSDKKEETDNMKEENIDTENKLSKYENLINNTPKRSSSKNTYNVQKTVQRKLPRTGY